MCLVAINGELLKVNQGDMLDDIVCTDVVRLSASRVFSCAEFREKAIGEKEAEDKKQVVADAIMAELEKMHIEGEQKRKQFLM